MAKREYYYDKRIISRNKRQEITSALKCICFQLHGNMNKC